MDFRQILIAAGMIGGVAHAGVQIQFFTVGLSAPPTASRAQDFKLPAQPLRVAAQGRRQFTGRGMAGQQFLYAAVIR